MNTLILLFALLGQDKPFTDADPKPAIEAAKKKAAAENRRVLVLWGANNSEESLATATMFKKDKQVARTILYEYDLVLADIRHRPPPEESEPTKLLIPPLAVIMDAEGKVLFNSAAPASGPAMLELLKKHQAPPWKAQDVLDAAKKKAAAEKKRVLLTFGAPW